VTGGLTVGVASAVPNHGNLLMNGALPIWGGLAATTGWDIWSLRDVYGTTVRRNRLARDLRER
jgi:hypothetical protein